MGYRDWLVAAASALGLTGTVRNRDDAVEAHVHGSRDRLDRLAHACLTGPPGARPLGIERTGSTEPAPARFTRAN